MKSLVFACTVGLGFLGFGSAASACDWCHRPTCKRWCGSVQAPQVTVQRHRIKVGEIYDEVEQFTEVRTWEQRKRVVVCTPPCPQTESAPLTTPRVDEGPPAPVPMPLVPPAVSARTYYCPGCKTYHPVGYHTRGVLGRLTGRLANREVIDY